MPTIKLQSSDGELFEVDVEIAKQSVTIKTMLEGTSSEPCRTQDFVPASFTSFIIQMIYQTMVHITGETLDKRLWFVL